jgi:hypothetical protein
VISRPFLVAATAGFVLVAALHLASFLPLPPLAGDAPALALLAGAFVLLVAMLARLGRAGAPTRPWRRWRVYDGGALVSLVPMRMRWLAFATVLYVSMNFLLSLAAGAGLSASATDGTGPAEPREESRREDQARHRVTMRLFSGHLLLFYLVPLLYFRFVDPRLAELGRPDARQGDSA